MVGACVVPLEGPRVSAVGVYFGDVAGSENDHFEDTIVGDFTHVGLS
jgi:hypothetical protein